MINANINAIGVSQEAISAFDFSTPPDTGSLILWVNSADVRSYPGSGSSVFNAAGNQNGGFIEPEGFISWNPVDKFFSFYPAASSITVSAAPATSSFINITGSLPPSSSFTIVATIYPDENFASGGFQQLLTWSDKSFGVQAAYSASTDSLQFNLQTVGSGILIGTGAPGVTGSIDIPLNDMSSIAITYDDVAELIQFYYVNSEWIYQDVVPLFSYYTKIQALTAPTDGGPAYAIGGRIANLGQHFGWQSKIQSVLLYNKVLNNTEINSCFKYNRDTSGYYTPAPDLLLDIDFANISGSSIPDTSAYQNSYAFISDKTGSFNPASGGFITSNGDALASAANGNWNDTIPLNITSSHTTLFVVNPGSFGDEKSTFLTIGEGGVTPRIETFLCVSGSVAGTYHFGYSRFFDPIVPDVRLTSSLAYPINEWHMFTSTYDGDQMQIWVDNTLSSTLSGINPGYRVKLDFNNGILFSDSANPGAIDFSGSMGIYKIWNKVLTPEEIEEQYNTYKDRFGLV
jgi:hypothetical protein